MRILKGSLQEFRCSHFLLIQSMARTLYYFALLGRLGRHNLVARSWSLQIDQNGGFNNLQ
eukprot:1147189-Pelagomonas_calceolata.AAC.2